MSRAPHRLLSLGAALALLGACSSSSPRESRREAKADRRAAKAEEAEQAKTKARELPRMPAAEAKAERVVLVIADDLGVDALASYADISGVADGERPFPATPTIDGLCRDGVRFTRAWATPTCTPTRASILTGRHGFRTGLDGVGRAMQIKADEYTLPRLLGDETAAKTANIGKWHLGEGQEVGGTRAPNTMGWDHYAGSLSNLEDYFTYTRVIDGKEQQPVKAYATTQTVDDALAWARAQDPDDAWLIWIAFNAPHGPFHLPPDELHQHPGASEGADQYDAMVEALDAELGRLLASLPPDVTVIFMGDNGSPAKSIRAPRVRKRGKGTLYEGGVHVPLCIAGAGVTSSGSQDALVSSVDLFATIANLMGVAKLPDGIGEDSHSMLAYLRGTTPSSPREFIYSEQNRTHERNARQQGGRTIRDERYKLIRFEDGSEALYDLRKDPTEAEDLSGSADAAARAAKAELGARLDALK